MSAALACGNTDAPLWLQPHPDFLLLLPALLVLFRFSALEETLIWAPWQRKREVGAA